MSGSNPPTPYLVPSSTTMKNNRGFDAVPTDPSDIFGADGKLAQPPKAYIFEELDWKDETELVKKAREYVKV